jgi:hypothetical protein
MSKPKNNDNVIELDTEPETESKLSRFKTRKVAAIAAVAAGALAGIAWLGSKASAHEYEDAPEFPDSDEDIPLV